ncbi:hypothetical protein [Metabacillus fastidiosus]|uniref:hypothetical protein n=1 Tax=Metabacillus fastidiosus TaxID=1458 RepID=UPI00082698F6|nr:hypothetical protein [Metabacillus fastidiosus]MED4462066.1 hypothetical protein [Metabacillus fastidiosus]
MLDQYKRTEIDKWIEEQLKEENSRVLGNFMAKAYREFLEFDVHVYILKKWLEFFGNHFI